MNTLLQGGKIWLRYEFSKFITYQKNRKLLSSFNRTVVLLIILQQKQSALLVVKTYLELRYSHVNLW